MPPHPDAPWPDGIDLPARQSPPAEYLTLQQAYVALATDAWHIVQHFRVLLDRHALTGLSPTGRLIERLAATLQAQGIDGPLTLTDTTGETPPCP